ncbi:MAG: response regulator [Paludibacter sp.]
METTNQYSSNTEHLEATISEINSDIADSLKKGQNLKLIFLVSIIFLILLSAFFVRDSWVRQKTETEGLVMKAAKTSALLLDAEMLKSLSAIPEDIGTVAYESIKSRLIAMAKENKDIRFAYLYTQRNNKLYFIVDSEPANSKDMSPAGQEYTEAAPEYSKPFKNGNSIITKPATDRWGTWVSVLIPIKNHQTGKTIAVFAVDYPAKNFHADAKSHTLTSTLISILALLILIGFYRTIINNSKLKLEQLKTLEINKKLIEKRKEQELADEALNKERILLRTIIESIPDSIYVKDLECRKTLANKANCRNMGFDKEEDVIGKTDFDIWPPEIAQPFYDDDQQVLKHGKTIVNREEKILLPNGEIVWLLTSKLPLYDEKGRITGLVGVGRNITIRKKAETELVIAKEQAEAASKAKSEFLANMSHEIRTPLNGVIGFTDLLQSTALSMVQKQYVHNANVSGHALLGIINNILDFSKIEAGMMDLEIVKTDIVELLGQSADIVKYTADKKHLEILLNIDPKMPRFAMVDSVRLKQIFANLMGNAVKFTEKGEIELKVLYENISKKKGRFYFSIRDTGIGISEENQTKLFKSFSQADSSTTRKFGGTGLGLVISQMIAQKMGSKINISSKPGEGTTFFFDIETEIEFGEKIFTDNIQSINRCLVIDDNLNNRTILEDTLANWGIKCVSCDNGLDALKIIENSDSFDIVICDYHMPFMDGLETIKLIREKLKLAPDKLPIILLHSSSDDAELHRKSDDLGVRFLLTKPVKSNDLYSYLCNIHSPIDAKITEEKKIVQPLSEKSTDSFTILIAEDVDMNMLLVKFMINKLLPEAKILEAKDGKEAVGFWENERPDLILMDIQMPVMDGVEATINIRKLEKSTDIHVPIIALTAGAIQEEQEQCMNAGMDDFLTKPINNDLLKKVILKYLKVES